MLSEIVNPEEVRRTLDIVGLRNGDEVAICMYLTMRDPEFEQELYMCLNDCLDDMGIVDILLTAERIQIPVEQSEKEYTFDVRFLRRRKDDDVGAI